jgi:hypothetical protein
MTEQSSLSNEANQTSFIESYIDYASDLTDAPEIYHQVLGLNLLSLTSTEHTAMALIKKYGLR